MDNKAEVREFLMTRRARISPADVGLPAGVNRRVAGLRRTEVAMLADVSVEYYAKLERGDIAGASAGVLESLARALRLDETERMHLLDLARSADGIPTSGRARRRATPQQPARAGLQRTLDAITGGPAFVRDRHQNLVATNALGAAFYSPVIGTSGRAPNLARFQFLDPASRDFYPDWDLFAQMCVGIMRVEAGRDPHDRAMQDLVGELTTRSETFARLWSAHDVRTHGTGTKRFHHPVVGALTVLYEELAVTAEDGLRLIVYTAEPGSPTAERLQLLASWSTAVPAAAPTAVGDHPHPSIRAEDAT
ncbi:helix-turn-helix transcriptional regulator [Oceanitalea stevensii]|uniref:Helix-turn-helix domain-containing protein n=1 Tax=Oceanitalea stevensii TaxID=2763072 RepID=A0ABR8YXG6_9MICO|nr:helix-turn-helix transcriptional regulator [Oceanitalea stevensii]MBD8060720.1 helix-turn-helix domain-containing protein [Oceanitalea stevensii]